MNSWVAPASVPGVAPAVNLAGVVHHGLCCSINKAEDAYAAGPPCPVQVLVMLVCGLGLFKSCSGPSSAD
jgi:hypothetical protein